MANTNANNKTQQPDELEQLKAQLAEAEARAASAESKAADAESRAAAAEAELQAAAEADEQKAETTQMKMVKIRLPKTRKDEEDVFVSVNDYTCLIKRGIEVEVPDFVAEVLQHREQMLMGE